MLLREKISVKRCNYTKHPCIKTTVMFVLSVDLSVSGLTFIMCRENRFFSPCCGALILLLFNILPHLFVLGSHHSVPIKHPRFLLISSVVQPKEITFHLFEFRQLRIKLRSTNKLSSRNRFFQ